MLAHYATTLDATGNRTRVTETVGGVTRGISYTYDSLYRNHQQCPLRNVHWARIPVPEAAT